MFHAIYFYVYPSVGTFMSDSIILEYPNGISKKSIIKGMYKKLLYRYNDMQLEPENIRIIAIVDDFYSQDEAEAYLIKYPIKQTRMSFSVQWHFTKVCNQRCVQCYLGSEQFHGMLDENELSEQELYEVVDKFYSFCNMIQASPVFVLTGGHPLLSPKLKKILSYIDNQYRKKGWLANIFILGNPQYLEENIDMLEAHNVDSYQISIDGTEKMHDEWRGKGSFSASMRALDLLKKSTISPKIMSTLSKKNAEDVINLYKLLCEKGAPFFAYSRLVPNCSEKSANYFDEHFTGREYRDFLEKMFNVILKMREQGYTTQFVYKDHLWKPFLAEKGIWNFDERYGNDRNTMLIYDGCHINQDSLCIGTNGNVYACMKTESYLGNIREQSFEEIYTCSRAEYFRNYEKYEGCNVCGYKQYCRGCHAVSYGVYGDFYKPDPQCWFAERLFKQNEEGEA